MTTESVPAPGAAAAGLAVAAVEVTGPATGVDTAGHAGVRVIALHRGVPIGDVDLIRAGPDPVIPGPRVRAELEAALGQEIARADLLEALRVRLGAPAPEDLPRRSVTVVVCTRDRRERLAGCLAALAALDPAPDDVIVVDNAPSEPCDDLVAAAGFRYVCEPIAGLDNARNRGLLEARTEVVAYTDDDCRPVPGWLRPLRRHLMSGATAAVTGIGCPRLLGTEAQIAFEAAAGFSLGYRERAFDSAILRPTAGGAVGAGANMAVRVDRLRELGGFPPELDVGTPTRSGGDIYVLGRLIGRGWRVVYDPAQMVWHDHRAGDDEVARVLEGYGVGLSAMLTRALVRDRSASAVVTFGWPAKNVARAAVRTARGRAAPRELSSALRLAAAVPRGPRAWARSRRLPGRTVPAAAAVAPARPARPPVPGAEPELTVVVPTIASRAAALGACVAALSDQTLPRGRYEIVVVANGPGADGTALPPGADRLLVLPEPSAGRARNAGADAARGRVVAFVDDDVVAGRGCLEAHLAAVTGPDVVSLGPYFPEPADGPLGQRIMRWWFDALARIEVPGHRFTFVDLAAGNFALERRLYARVGGFDPVFPTAHREDWELGWRLLEAGARLTATPAASALHHHAITPDKFLRDGVARGFGDLVLCERHPDATSTLPIGRLAHHAGTARWRAAVALGRRLEDPRGRAALLAPLAPLRASGTWRRWFQALTPLQVAGYCAGVQRGLDAGHVLPAAPPHRTRLELRGDAPVAVGYALGDIEVTVDGRVVGVVSPPSRQWDAHEIAAAVADGLDPRIVAAVARGTT